MRTIATLALLLVAAAPMGAQGTAIPERKPRTTPGPVARPAPPRTPPSAPGHVSGAPPATAEPAPSRPHHNGRVRYPQRVNATHWQETFARIPAVELRCGDSVSTILLAMAHAHYGDVANRPGHSGRASEMQPEYLLELHTAPNLAAPPFPAGSRYVLTIDGRNRPLPAVRDCVVSHSWLSATPSCAALSEADLYDITTSRSIGVTVVRPAPGARACVATLDKPSQLRLVDQIAHEYRYHRMIVR